MHRACRREGHDLERSPTLVPPNTGREEGQEWDTKHTAGPQRRASAAADTAHRRALRRPETRRGAPPAVMHGEHTTAHGRPWRDVQYCSDRPSPKRRPPPRARGPAADPDRGAGSRWRSRCGPPPRLQTFKAGAPPKSKPEAPQKNPPTPHSLPLFSNRPPRRARAPPAALRRGPGAVAPRRAARATLRPRPPPAAPATARRPCRTQGSQSHCKILQLDPERALRARLTARRRRRSSPVAARRLQ